MKKYKFKNENNNTLSIKANTKKLALEIVNRMCNGRNWSLITKNKQQ